MNNYKQETYKTLAKLALKLHNFSYKLATKLSIKAEGGLHPKHRLMKYHKFFVDNIAPGETVLDIGCGNGALSHDLSKKAEKIVGIDLNEENIKLAKKDFSAPNIEYLVGDATKSLPGRKFDTIILSNVLEHIENRVDFLKRIKDLAPGILIRVPMINREWITLYKKELKVEWRLDQTHYTEYTLELLKEELQEAGLRIDEFSIQFGEIWAVVKCESA